MKFVKAITNTPDRRLKYLLHKHLSRSEAARPYLTLHASAVTREEVQFCPREYALGHKLLIQPPATMVPTPKAVTYALGHMMQRRVLLWFAEIGVAVGDWKCLHCGRVSRFCKRPKMCSVCSGGNIDPVEVRFTSTTSGISCGIDMLADVGADKYLLVEIKTVKPEDFKSMVAPAGEHRARTNLYLRTVDESDHPMKSSVNTQVARVLYVSKGGFGNKDEELKLWGIQDGFSPFKEFDVTRDDAATAEYHRFAQMVAQYRAGTGGVPAGICPTPLCSRAKWCPVKAACFGGAYPATVFE